jgi:hypothetical protein
MSAPHNLFNTLQTFDLGNGKQGNFYSLPALEKAGIGRSPNCPFPSASCWNPSCATAMALKVSGGEREGTRELETRGIAHGGNPVRGRAHRVAGFHRRAAARGPGGDAQRGREARQKSENHRAARAGGFGRGPFGAGGFRGRGGFDATQSGPGIHPQPRALPVFEMGHAGVRHVQGRSAGHRHRASGEFGISRQRRS